MSTTLWKILIQLLSYKTNQFIRIGSFPELTLIKMDQKFLVEVMSEFDISYKYFRINMKNQINRNYGHFYWILCLICLTINLINIMNLLLISDEDEDPLMKVGSMGFSLGGKSCRFMIDLAVLSLTLRS